MKPLCTTLQRIESCAPCTKGWKTLLRGLGKTGADNEPLAYSRILEICGLADAVWTLRAEPQLEREWRIMAVKFARTVQHLMEDKRSIDALDTAEKYAKGQATKQELDAAYAAATAAYDAAYAAAAYAASAAAHAAYATAAYAASAYAAAAAYAAATDAAAAYAAATASYAQREKIFLDVVGQK